MNPMGGKNTFTDLLRQIAAEQYPPTLLPRALARRGALAAAL